MPKKLVVIMDEVHNAITAVMLKEALRSMKPVSYSKGVNYLVVLGLESYKAKTPSASDLKIPTFSIDKPTRKARKLCKEGSLALKG